MFKITNMHPYSAIIHELEAPGSVILDIGHFAIKDLVRLLRYAELLAKKKPPEQGFVFCVDRMELRVRLGYENGSTVLPFASDQVVPTCTPTWEAVSPRPESPNAGFLSDSRLRTGCAEPPQRNA